MTSSAIGVSAAILRPAFAFELQQLILSAPPVVLEGRKAEISFQLVLKKSQTCLMVILATDAGIEAELGCYLYSPQERVIRGSVITTIHKAQTISAVAILNDHQHISARTGIEVFNSVWV